MKIATIVGARPQFIKAAPVTTTLRQAGHQEILIHTGQHYDYKMSQVFFEELGLPAPQINLEVGSGSHGWQIGQILIRLEEILLAEKPDWVLVYGDTNSTLAGALAACKLHLPLAHIEAGLRSFNRAMPEEHNRVLTDHCADLLFCPTQTAVDNLRHEGLTQSVYLVGDTMYEAVLQFMALAQQQSSILAQLNLTPKKYLLATIHRPYNTDITENLRTILSAFIESNETIIFPVHPRTRHKILELSKETNLDFRQGQIKMIEPVGYLDMLILQQNARLILTDSGGMQKEAYFLGVPCLTLRPETEWLETLKDGWNVLVGADYAAIITQIQQQRYLLQAPAPVFGTGRTAQLIINQLVARQTKFDG